jgi:hypothetical protein
VVFDCNWPKAIERKILKPDFSRHYKDKEILEKRIFPYYGQLGFYVFSSVCLVTPQSRELD